MGHKLCPHAPAFAQIISQKSSAATELLYYSSLKIRTRKPPSAFSKQTLQAELSATRRTMDNPKPLPETFCPAGRKNLSLKCAKASSSTETPELNTCNAPSVISIFIFAPCGLYFKALSNKLRKTKPHKSGLPCSTGPKPDTFALISIFFSFRYSSRHLQDTRVIWC